MLGAHVRLPGAPLSRRLIAIAVAIAGCGSSDPDPPPAPAPAPVAAVPVVPEIPVLADPPPFHFHLDVEGEIPAVLGSLGVGPRAWLHLVGDPRVYVADAGSLERRDDDETVRWSVPCELASPVVAARIEPGIDHAIVAGIARDGFALVAHDARDGALAWRSEIRGPDVELVQLSIAGPHIVVSARGRRVDFVDLLDASDGHLIGRATLPHAVTRVPLEPPASAARPTEHRSPCTAIARASSEIRSEHCPGATGVEVIATDSAGRERWRARPFGIGSIGHSGYSNEVAIAIERSLVRVWGHESGGDYVATIDLASGREIADVVRRR